MSLRGFYKTDVVTVSPDQSIRDAAEIMRQRNVGNVVVVDEKGGKRKPVGMLTDRDIVVKCIAKGAENIDNIKVEDVMSAEPVCCYESEGVYEVAQKMRKEGVGRMPILDENESLIGIVTSKNILALLSDELSELVSISDAQKAAATTTGRPTHQQAQEQPTTTQ